MARRQFCWRRVVACARPRAGGGTMFSVNKRALLEGALLLVERPLHLRFLFLERRNFFSQPCKLVGAPLLQRVHLSLPPFRVCSSSLFSLFFFT